MPELLVLCPIPAPIHARLDETFDHVTMANYSQHAADIRYVLTDGGLGVPNDLFAELPNLKLISSIGVGYDAIDTDLASARGVPVCHTPDVLNEEVATTALMLFVACWRNLEAEMAHARSGAWARDGGLPLSRTADRRTVGILGLGRIGKAIARKLAPFQPDIHYCGRSRQDVPFQYHASLTDMAQTCDTLISVLPGGPATDRLIDRAVLEALGPGGYLINVGRGSTVDEPALIAALQDGRLGGAALDVFANEPHIPEALRALPNVILTPHIGSATVETRKAMGDLAIDNLLAHRDGKPLLSPVPESAGLL